MKRKILAIISLLSIIIGCAGLPKPKQYTACNIWIYPNMRCINFKASSNFIPAGTEITLRKGFCKRGICFRTALTGRKVHVMQFNSRWHPGKTMNDYSEFFFTTKNFAELTQGLTSREIKAIKQGLVVEGMSKKAVLISYGKPPEHRTPFLSSNVWKYWMNTTKQKEICFDENKKTIRCHRRTVDGFKPQNTQSDYQKLLELKQLKDKGIISTEEYEQKKKKYLLKY